MLRWFAQTLEAARQAAVLLCRTRIFWLLLAACAGAAVFFAMVASRAAPHVTGDEFFGAVTYMVFFQFGLPFAVLYFGVTAVHTEIGDRTATYLFVRQVRRSSLLVGKWLAIVVLGSALAAAAMSALYLAMTLPDLAWNRGLAPRAAPLGSFVVAGCLAVPAYGAVGVCFGSFFRRPLIAGVAFVICWEFMASHAPPQAGIRGMTVADPIRRWLLVALQPQGELRDILQRDLDPSWLVRGQLADPVSSLLSFTAVMMLLALAVYTHREYDSRPRE